MAYDEHLAQRIRELAADEPAVTERPMFGGLAFLVAGHMAVAASGQGGLMVRVDPERGDELCEREGAQPMVMRGRPMSGWLRVGDAAVADEMSLAWWVDQGLAYARGLPPKAA